MSMKGQLFFALAAFFTVVLLFDMTQAEIWERNGKSQRSTPSLRLRFGRSATDIPAPLSVEKRWFGDVNKKPIRSPSLRLRFGRRSDPSLRSTDHLPGSNFINDDFDGSAFKRILRKPQLRLRFGRNAPSKFWIDNSFDNQVDNHLDDETEDQSYDNLLTDLLNAARLRNMLLALRNYEDEGDDENDEFQRETRKPAALRLRFGRSTAGGPSAASPDVAISDINEQNDSFTSETINNKD